MKKLLLMCLLSIASLPSFAALNLCTQDRVAIIDHVNCVDRTVEFSFVNNQVFDDEIIKVWPKQYIISNFPVNVQGVNDDVNKCGRYIKRGAKVCIKGEVVQWGAQKWVRNGVYVTPYVMIPVNPHLPF